MIRTMNLILDGTPLELDEFNRPMTVGPCLSEGVHKRCGTAEKIGYFCVGCIGAKFPLNKSLFHKVERPKKEPEARPQCESVFLPAG
jgi:hypothetical protein